MEYKLTDELLEQLATLSKLEITNSDKTELRKDLTQMLTYVDKLGELCTDDTLPLTHFPECTLLLDAGPSASSDSVQSLRLREDIPCPQSHPEQFIALAPKQEAPYFVVPNTFHNS